MNNNFKIKQVEEEDIPLLLSFIKKMAEYEKLENQVSATETNLKESLFGKKKYAEATIIFKNNIPAGYAVYFYNFSTFTGKPGLYLEDIFILPEFRGLGAGKELFRFVINKAKENECERLDWCVLDWNKPAIDFYNSFGAQLLDDWKVFRLDKQSLLKL